MVFEEFVVGGTRARQSLPRQSEGGQFLPYMLGASIVVDQCSRYFESVDYLGFSLLLLLRHHCAICVCW